MLLLPAALAPPERAVSSAAAIWSKRSCGISSCMLVPDVMGAEVDGRAGAEGGNKRGGRIRKNGFKIRTCIRTGGFTRERHESLPALRG